MNCYVMLVGSVECKSDVSFFQLNSTKFSDVALEIQKSCDSLHSSHEEFAGNLWHPGDDRTLGFVVEDDSQVFEEDRKSVV